MVTGTPKMITDGLVLYFDAANVKSYPGSGTNWVDLSPSAASATLTNGASFNGESNGVIRFDGTNDYIPTNFYGTYQRITLSAWVNNMSKPSTAAHVIGKNYFYATTTNSWPCALSVGETGGSIAITNGSAYSITEGVNGGTASGPFTASRWNHIAGMYDGATIKFYVNGLLTATQSYSGIINYSGSVGLPWTIGRPAGFNGGGTGFYYATGSIAIASIYNRALSDSEVLQNFEATRERFGV